MNKTFNQFLCFLAGSFVCLYLAFSATVNIPYASHDSIRFFHKFYNKDTESSTYPQYRYEYNLGRPISAELEGLLYKKVNHLSDMSRLRLITIFIFALSASLLAMTALSAGMETIPAFCLCTAIFTLPGVQDFIFVPYLTNALAIFISILAYILLAKRLKYAIHVVLSFFILETSFCLYPPSTFFFLIPAALTLIFHKDWQVTRRIWIRDVFLWVLAAGANYIILREFFYTQMKSSGHEIAFTLNHLWLNTETFFSQGMPQTFNLWNVYYSRTLGILLIFLVVAFIIINFFVNKMIGFRRLFGIMTIFIIVNLVWFFFGGYIPREFIASQALILALFFWFGGWFGNIGPVLFLCVGLIIGNQMMSSNVLNNYSELMFIRSRIAQFVNSETKEIHVIRLKDRTKGYNGLPTVYDNINGTTIDYEIPDLIRVALKDMGQPFELHCMVTYSNFGEALNLLPNAVVIDMNDLVYISSPQHK